MFNRLLSVENEALLTCNFTSQLPCEQRLQLTQRNCEVNRGTLTIKNLLPADNGLHKCVATNMIGAKKTRINVAVQRSSAAGLSYAARQQGRIQDFSKVRLHH